MVQVVAISPQLRNNVPGAAKMKANVIMIAATIQVGNN